MSLFEDRAVCERVNFYSHHIDPRASNVSGVMSLSNGHTISPIIPDQKYMLTTVSSNNPVSNNHLQVTSQSNGQVPVLVLDIAPNGAINIPTSLTVNGKPITGSSLVGDVSQETIDAMQAQINSLNSYIQDLKLLIRSLKESIYIDNNGQEFDYTNLIS